MKNIIKIIMLMLLMLPVTFAENETLEIESISLQDNIFYIDTTEDLNIYLIILSLLIASVLIIFTSIKWVGGLILIITGFILLVNITSLISILIIIAGVVAIFI